MQDLIVALSLALAIEGALYALFPNQMRRAVTAILEQPDERLRVMGVAAAVAGVGVVWLLRG